MNVDEIETNMKEAQELTTNYIHDLLDLMGKAEISASITIDDKVYNVTVTEKPLDA